MNAPSVTHQEVLDAIRGVVYTVLPDGVTTICQLTLDNGFTVNGQAACVCRENFDEAKGQTYAYEDAFDKVWPFLGFRLADRLMRERGQPTPTQLEIEFNEDLPSSNYTYTLERAPYMPEVGHQLFYSERAGDTVTDPMLATVASVLDRHHVNLSVLAPDGSLHPRQNIVVLSPDEIPPAGLRFWVRAP